jgi:hypothetical protein
LTLAHASRSGTATTSPLLRSIHGGIQVLRDDLSSLHAKARTQGAAPAGLMDPNPIGAMTATGDTD